MDRTALHLEIRNALEISDELSRHEHALGDDALAAQLSALRSVLDELERDVGQSHLGKITPHVVAGEAVRRTIDAIEARHDDVPRRLRGRLRLLVSSARRVAFAVVEPSTRVPSKPVAGVMPLARVVPQDAHSVLDYLAGAAAMLSTVFARTTAAKIVGANLGATGLASAKLTDHRLGVLKIVPIEAHEGFDLVWGAAAVASPFVFRYVKKDPIASAIQIAAGLSTIVVSLLTDYRASNGVTLPHRSRGGPSPHILRGMRRPPSEEDEPEVYQTRARRVPDVQRPLEGLSSAPTDWTPEGRRTDEPS